MKTTIWMSVMMTGMVSMMIAQGGLSADDNNKMELKRVVRKVRESKTPNEKDVELVKQISERRTSANEKIETLLENINTNVTTEQQIEAVEFAGEIAVQVFRSNADEIKVILHEHNSLQELMNASLIQKLSAATRKMNSAKQLRVEARQEQNLQIRRAIMVNAEELEIDAMETQKEILAMLQNDPAESLLAEK